MASPIELLEQRIEDLRRQVRQALMAGDRKLATSLRRQLREAESDWDSALECLAEDAGRREAPAVTREGQPAGPPPGSPVDRAAALGTGRPGRSGGSAPRPPAGTQAALESASPSGPASVAPSAGLTVPLREQVHQALTMLTVPAAPRLISAVHEAFFAGAIFSARVTSLRRDEERSFRLAPFARPYYICAALTADLLAPARGLLAVSTWPVERRVIGPLSPRVDFLTAAIQVAEGIQRIPDPSPQAWRLLWRFGTNIPGGADNSGEVSAPAVARAAHAERGVHADADLAARRDAGLRARGQLDDAQQLFGTRLGLSSRAGSAS